MSSQRKYKHYIVDNALTLLRANHSDHQMTRDGLLLLHSYFNTDFPVHLLPMHCNWFSLMCTTVISSSLCVVGPSSQGRRGCVFLPFCCSKMCFSASYLWVFSGRSLLSELQPYCSCQHNFFLQRWFMRSLWLKRLNTFQISPMGSMVHAGGFHFLPPHQLLRSVFVLRLLLPLGSLLAMHILLSQ